MISEILWDGLLGALWGGCFGYLLWRLRVMRENQDMHRNAIDQNNLNIQKLSSFIDEAKIKVHAKAFADSVGSLYKEVEK